MRASGCGETKRRRIVMGRLRGVDGREIETLGKVVVGVDGSEHSLMALRWALAEARLRVVPCVVLYACDIESRGEDTYVPPEELEAQVGHARATLARAMEHVPAELLNGAVVDEHIALSAPVDALISASQDAALLVVGTRGRSELKDLLLGSVSMALVHHGRCPVVVVPHEGRAAQSEAALRNRIVE
jgi:nucleotide-binding universal stress UspA family protein